ncbi:VOC family protein [Gracilibacillus sp. S3-1-1]|uniref:VOC family protein n=1 Tax=Gracilibacillus pellucidus TaxID=3095368 RepID=A0ACC6M362_9BACI|nr:VOC family protein [Gracilibacillus sp. S3-1-1]MDX8045287.1 VOC family protein [Gracilibacillus sp. S3-1-1]
MTHQEIYTGDNEPRIGYVELQVSNLEQSLSFYQETIGFKLLEKREKSAKLTTDGSTPLLSLIETDDYVKRPLGTTGLYHFAIVVPTRQDLALSLVHLLQSGYPVQGAADHQYSEALYLADPDNNGIEIYTDRNANDWIQTESGWYVGGADPLDAEHLLTEIKDATWSGLPDKTRIGHMHLQVANIEESEKFYVDTLGFDIVAKDTHMLFVSKDRYHHHIGMNIWAGKGLPQPPANALGLKHFTFAFTDEEYQDAKQLLEQNGYHFEEHEQSLTVVDPAGNNIKITTIET